MTETRINKLTRQIRRAAERRVDKPEPGEVQRTSIKHMGRKTKGMPYSRMILRDVTPSDLRTGSPAVFHLKHPTRRTTVSKPATPYLIELFMPGLPENLAQGMLGRHA